MEATADKEDVRQAQLFAWRMSAFLRMGFNEIDAEDLAVSEVDHHAIQALLDAGCPATLALRIVR